MQSFLIGAYILIEKVLKTHFAKNGIFGILAEFSLIKFKIKLT